MCKIIEVPLVGYAYLYTSIIVLIEQLLIARYLLDSVESLGNKRAPMPALVEFLF